MEMFFKTQKCLANKWRPLPFSEYYRGEKDGEFSQYVDIYFLQKEVVRPPQCDHEHFCEKEVTTFKVQTFPHFLFK